jgi:hypothetical protein
MTSASASRPWPANATFHPAPFSMTVDASDRTLRITLRTTLRVQYELGGARRGFQVRL